MLIGYIRVSQYESNTDMQFDAFEKIGCKNIFHEKISGAAKHRPEFEKMLAALRTGDTVVVWDTSRLGRDFLEMTKIVNRWGEEGIKLMSLQEPFLDTLTNEGDLLFKIYSLFNEYERKRKIFNTNAGLAAARKRGRIGGRKAGLTKRVLELAPTIKTLYNAKKHTVYEICKSYNISSATFYKCLRHEGEEIKGWRQSPTIIRDELPTELES